jgi:hypothetical protein
MTERVLGEKGGKRRKRFLFLPILVTTALALFWIAGAQAVHDEEFQLDGDVIASTTTSVGGSTQLLDWDSLFDATGAEKSLPANFTASDFQKDFNNSGTTFLTNDGTTYATGSKDTLPIADWQCNLDNNVNSKIDVMNAYAASYTDPVSGDDIVYFALERNVNTGDANVGFWFLQSDVACSSSGAAADFTGGHQDGDLLVVSEFSGGGDVSTINAYRWDGNDATGSLNPVPVASGADCRGDNVDPDDATCGAANTDSISTPWLTAAKTTIGNTLPEAQFFEGGVNLTDAGLGDTCFNTFIGDTRSSTSLTATLFDFARGQLGRCASGVTSAQNWLPNDSATVSVTGTATWSGAVAFTLHQGLGCTGTIVYGPQSVNVSQASPTVATTNTTIKALATQNYSWEVVFTPDAATAAKGVTPASGCEESELIVRN